MELVELQYAIYQCSFISKINRYNTTLNADIQKQCNVTAPTCCAGICTNLNTNPFSCGTCNTTVSGLPPSSLSLADSSYSARLQHRIAVLENVQALLMTPRTVAPVVQLYVSRHLLSERFEILEEF